MDTTLILMLAGALAIVAAGVRMMYCGHRHQVRRDRRSTDRGPA
jgi:uncharacterized protein involved in exopolysaccharide biosynthesis